MRLREISQIRWGIALVTLTLFSSPLLSKPVLLAPERGSQLMLVIGDKVTPFYRLDVDSGTYVNVTGPGELRLVTRFSLPAGVTSEATWRVEVSEGTKQLTSVDRTTAVSDLIWQGLPSRPCELFKFSLNVPEGVHRYRIGLSSSIKSFAGVRCLFSADGPVEPKSAVYPIEMVEATSVSLKEKTLDFFLADSVRPVTVRVIGPTKLRIVTRLAYSGLMKGPQKYSAVLTLDGKPIDRAALVTTKSPSTYFTNHKEWSVGESKTVYADVPLGTHEVSVRLGSSPAPALAVRFTIPKEDIGQ
jgi:hypothetical protein